jgi:3-oxoacyl-[acyl-carrier protein] reductase
MTPQATNGQNGSHNTKGTMIASNSDLLLNKTAIVTGASRGIGAAIALLLGTSGANVVVNYTSPKSEKRAQLVTQIINAGASGANAVAIRADITSDEGQQSLIDTALKLSPTNKIDILVHNAGDGADCYLKDITEDLYRDQTDLNLKGKLCKPTYAAYEILTS